MTQVRARVAAEALIERIQSLEKEGVSIELTSCCCREAILIHGADITPVEIKDYPEGWTIEDV